MIGYFCSQPQIFKESVRCDAQRQLGTCVLLICLYLLFQWIANPLNDMYADAVTTVVLEVQSNPKAQKGQLGYIDPYKRWMQVR